MDSDLLKLIEQENIQHLSSRLLLIAPDVGSPQKKQWLENNYVDEDDLEGEGDGDGNGEGDNGGTTSREKANPS